MPVANIRGVNIFHQVIGDRALLTCPGAPSRQGEPAATLTALHSLGLQCTLMARVKGVDVSLEAALKIVAVHALGPAVPYFQLHCPADEIEPGLIEPVTKLVRPGPPDHDRGVIGELPEEALALVDRLDLDQ